MTAKNFHNSIFSKLRPPTERKTINLARKCDLLDSLDELVYWLGAYVSETKLREFAVKE